MRTAISRRLLLIAAAIAVLSGAVTRGAESENESREPRIADCRIGFDGCFKVGHWTPLWIAVEGDAGGKRLVVDVTTLDSDGVEVTVSAPLETSSESVDGIWPLAMHTMVGRIASPIRIVLRTESRIVDRYELPAGEYSNSNQRLVTLPSTGVLIVQFGSSSIGLDEAFYDRDEVDGELARRTVRLSDVDALPTDWFGYDSVDVLVISTADADPIQRLATDQRRMDALEKWLELGGRIVVSCGRNAPELLGKGGPLPALVPGEFIDVIRLPQTQGLESFEAVTDDSEQGIAGRDIPAVRLRGVRGHVEVFGRGRDLPLVIRTVRGLGELVFVGVDLDAPPLAEWSGRKTFVRALLGPYLPDDEARISSQALVSSGYNDVAGAVRQQLGRAFASVTPITFPIVAGLTIGYLLLLGPIDYLLVHRLLRRPWMAWITLPIMILLASGGTLLMSAAYKRNVGARLNSAELVDFDLATGRARGTCWATIYSSRARRFDVALDPRLPNDEAVEPAQTLLSWLGLPGSGLGGMHAAGLAPDVIQPGYRLAPALDGLEDLPILTSSTKSLLASWNAVVEPPCTADLTVDDDGLLVGSVVNQSGAAWKNACLLHGNWGYRLGDIAPGKRIRVGPELDPRQVHTLISRRVGREARGNDSGPTTNMFFADRASLDELLNVLMFYEIAGGESFARLTSRYHARSDLSRILDLDRAILVATGTGRGSRWIDRTNNDPLGDPQAQDKSLVMYRIIIPLQDPQPPAP